MAQTGEEAKELRLQSRQGKRVQETEAAMGRNVEKWWA